MERTWKPTTAGTLNIISGLMGIVGGIMLMSLAAGMLFITPAMIADAFGVTPSIIPRLGAISLTFGVIALVGGIYAIKRRNWGLALTTHKFLPLISSRKIEHNSL